VLPPPVLPPPVLPLPLETPLDPPEPELEPAPCPPADTAPPPDVAPLPWPEAPLPLLAPPVPELLPEPPELPELPAADVPLLRLPLRSATARPGSTADCATACVAGMAAAKVCVPMTQGVDVRLSQASCDEAACEKFDTAAAMTSTLSRSAVLNSYLFEFLMFSPYEQSRRFW
jgi:hypothetical protein